MLGTVFSGIVNLCKYINRFASHPCDIPICMPQACILVGKQYPPMLLRQSFSGQAAIH